ncbi:MAG: IS1634 family transposase [Chloroflexi bacterium]|nr:IS1634 family transposase [Chloroflexota bacterium]
MESGATDSLLRSLGRFSRQVKIIDNYQQGRLEAGRVKQLGPDLVFGRLWQETGIQKILWGLLKGREYEFPVERAIYLTVLHRLFQSGSDRAAEHWKRDVNLPGGETLRLHHLYRAMRWLGEVKDSVEEALFLSHQDLFSDLSLAFFDTTSIYFEGAGGESLGQYGNSKDHRPDLRQMVMGAVLTGEGRPVCCELWPGNQADANSLLPVVDRLCQRFGLRRVCWVADRGMISQQTIEGLEERKLEYILGARMRRQKEVREDVLERSGRYQEVAENLRVKEVWVGERRYIVCHNPHEALKDAADREAIVKSLEDQLKNHRSQLVGNTGYRKYLRLEKGAFSLDRQKVEAEARYDGKFVLRTNTELPASEVALHYKRLLLVEQFFRAVKSMLDSRPIFHQGDETIRGHVFCSFLALLLHHELEQRLKKRSYHFEWDVIRQDLESLAEVEVREEEQWYLLRTALQGVAGRVLQVVGVAMPPSVRLMDNVVPKN